MKRSISVLALLLMVSCSLVDHEPDLTSNFIGTFSNVYEVNEGAITQEWKVSKNDPTHIDVALQWDFKSKSPNATDHSKLSNIDHVLVKSPTLLEFNNEYDDPEGRATITGTAELVGDTITYFLTTKFITGGSDVNSFKVYRR